LFALPFFDFSADSDSQIVGRGFGYYLAVALPLTASVLIAYGLYKVLQQRRHGEKDDDIEEPRQRSRMKKRLSDISIFFRSSLPEFNNGHGKWKNPSSGTPDPELGLARWRPTSKG